MADPPAWDYAELKAQITEYLINDDVDADAQEAIILLAEAELSRRLSSHLQTTTISGTANSESIALPDDFIEPVTFYLDRTPKVVLTYLPPEVLRANEENYTDAANPVFYSIIGDNAVLLPAPTVSSTSNYVLEYLKALQTVTTIGINEAGTNWLLTRHKDIYLYACLAQAAQYLNDPVRGREWEARLDRLLAQLSRNATRQKYRGPATTQRIGAGAKVI